MRPHAKRTSETATAIASVLSPGSFSDSARRTIGAYRHLWTTAEELLRLRGCVFAPSGDEPEWRGPSHVADGPSFKRESRRASLRGAKNRVPLQIAVSCDADPSFDTPHHPARNRLRLPPAVDAQRRRRQSRRHGAPFGRGENADPASNRPGTGRVRLVPTDTVCWHSRPRVPKTITRKTKAQVRDCSMVFQEAFHESAAAW